jgi:hypothetical protein
MGERYSADRKTDDTDDDEDDAYNSSGFHWAFLVPSRCRFCVATARMLLHAFVSKLRRNPSRREK